MLLDTYTTPSGHVVDLYHNPASPTDPTPDTYQVDRRDPPAPDSPLPLGPVVFSITGRNREAMMDVFNLWR